MKSLSKTFLATSMAAALLAQPVTSIAGRPWTLYTTNHTKYYSNAAAGANGTMKYQYATPGTPDKNHPVTKATRKGGVVRACGHRVVSCSAEIYMFPKGNPHSLPADAMHVGHATININTGNISVEPVNNGCAMANGKVHHFVLDTSASVPGTPKLDISEDTAKVCG